MVQVKPTEIAKTSPQVTKVEETKVEAGILSKTMSGVKTVALLPFTLLAALYRAVVWFVTYPFNGGAREIARMNEELKAVQEMSHEDLVKAFAGKEHAEEAKKLAATVRASSGIVRKTLARLSFGVVVLPTDADRVRVLSAAVRANHPNVVAN